MSANTLKVMEDCWAAIESMDYAHATDLYAEDAVHVDNALGQVLNGQAQIKGFFNEWRDLTENEEYKVTVDVLTAADDGTWAAEWNWHIKMNGDFNGFPTKGRTFDVPGASIGKVKDGKIVLWHDYYNALAVFVQLGLIEMPAPAGAA